MTAISHVPIWATYLLLAIVSYFAIRVYSKLLTSRTKSILDDFIAQITARHVAIALIFVGLYYGALEFGMKPTLARNIMLAFQLVNGVIFLKRLYPLTIDAITQYLWNRSLSRSAGFAVPLMVRACVAILIAASALMFVYLVFGFEGFQLSITIIGALSFLLAYVFQEPLQNLFGGVTLLLDSPFEYGDLIILDDGKTFRVDHTGSRVTQLYDIKEHTHAYVPNLSLGTQTIVNITHPDTELREVIQIGVAYGTNLEKAKKLLSDICTAHPNILSPADKKIELLQKQETKPKYFEVEKERIRLDGELRIGTEALFRHVMLVEEYARRAEAYGLSDAQRGSLCENIDCCVSELQTIAFLVASWLRHESYIDMLHAGKLLKSEHIEKFVLRELKSPLDGNGSLSSAMINPAESSGSIIFHSGIVPSLKHFSDAIGKSRVQPVISSDVIGTASQDLTNELSNVATFDDMSRSFDAWRRRLQQVDRTLKEAKKCAERHGADDYLVHEHLGSAKKLLQQKFKLQVPGQQFPSVDILEFGGSTIDLRLEYFVDNIAGEHFKRRERVRSEMIISIDKAFANAKIDMPFPHIQIVKG